MGVMLRRGRGRGSGEIMRKRKDATAERSVVNPTGNTCQEMRILNQKEGQTTTEELHTSEKVTCTKNDTNLCQL